MQRVHQLCVSGLNEIKTTRTYLWARNASGFNTSLLLTVRAAGNTQKTPKLCHQPNHSKAVDHQHASRHESVCLVCPTSGSTIPTRERKRLPHRELLTCESLGTVRLRTLNRLCVRAEITALAPPGGAMAQISCVSRIYLHAHLALSYLFGRKAKRARAR